MTRAFDGKDLGDEEMYTGQIALRWEPSDALAAHAARRLHEGRRERLAVRVSRDERSGDVRRARPASPPAVRISSIRFRRPCSSVRWTIRVAATMPRRWATFTNGGTYPASSTLENHGVSLVARWDLNDTLTLKSITSDRHLEWTGTRDADNTPLLILHTNYTSQQRSVQPGIAGARRHASGSMACSACITSTRIRSIGCWCRWGIPALRTTHSE